MLWFWFGKQRGEVGNTINENEDNFEQVEQGERWWAWLDNGPLHMLHIHCLPNKGRLGL